MNKPVLPVSSLSLKLAKADRGIETYRLASLCRVLTFQRIP
jgi:hypothetical protein